MKLLTSMTVKKGANATGEDSYLTVMDSVHYVTRTSVKGKFSEVIKLTKDYYATISDNDYIVTKADLGINVVGCLYVESKAKVDVTNTVFIETSHRNKGLAYALYTLAHKRAKHDLTSSTELGSMSLGLWLKLARNNKSITLFNVTNKNPIDRKLIDFTGDTPLIEGVAWDKGRYKNVDFIFVWPK